LTGQGGRGTVEAWRESHVGLHRGIRIMSRSVATGGCRQFYLGIPVDASYPTDRMKPIHFERGLLKRGAL